MENKQHNIETIEDLLNVITLENKDCLIEDVKHFLTTYVIAVEGYKEFVNERCPNSIEGKSNTDILKSGFLWTDDNKPGVTKISITTELYPEKGEYYGKEDEI